MRKLKLDLDTLDVETFETGGGGVKAKSTTDCTETCTMDANCADSAYTGCAPCPTARTYCHQNTCAQTCPATCMTCGSTCPESCIDTCGGCTF